jgi:hypothetical protein
MHPHFALPGLRPLAALAGTLVVTQSIVSAEVKPTAAFSSTDVGFKIGDVPAPSRNDSATGAKFSLVDGQRDGNGAELATLHDGAVPVGDDEPSANFFFRGGSNGGRIGIDLGEVKPIRALHTYSWHSGSRAPQVYTLYTADGKAEGFEESPKRATDPTKVGWTKVAKVDTRPEGGEGGGGQHAVAIGDAAAEDPALGDIRYLLLDVETATGAGPFGDTFYSEIDVIAATDPDPEPIKKPEKSLTEFKSDDGTFTYLLDTTLAPDLLAWCEKELMPVVKTWYPKIIELLPSDGYTAPQTILLEFRDDMGGTPAYATGNRVAMSAPWFRNELEREARGCVVHELVHVVQNYWRARATNRRPSPTPSWVTEGIADYIRWFLYEPESRGAELNRRNIGNAKFDASYRTTANFLDWVIKNRDKDLLRKLNAAAREGKYSADLWKTWTDKSVEELGEEWKADNEKRLAQPPKEG